MTVLPLEGCGEPSVAPGNTTSGEKGNDREITLGPSKADHVASVTRAGLAFVPWAGPIIAELVGNVIPNQRIERLEEFVRQLRDRVEDPRRIAEDPRRVDLFEDGCFLTVRAVEKKRIEHIVEVVSRGLTGSEKELLEARRMMRLLAEIDVDHVVFLESKIRGRRTEEFEQRHAEILMRPRVAGESPPEMFDPGTLWDLRVHQLTRLGLLQPRFRRAERGKNPEWDHNTGMMKTQGWKLTRLGLLLLRYLNLADGKSLST